MEQISIISIEQVSSSIEFIVFAILVIAIGVIALVGLWKAPVCGKDY